ncbi:hypothetical protein BN1708_015734 [Verticillium longisporum]|uniref:Uncharacterized protein n=1 Tax=Verticillium longisporum TaxID=100787 RepID=A0A0G4M7W8_VERLO|nr:hypothetical protein BN1708_015734 [Verticillium longisporum]
MIILKVRHTAAAFGELGARGEGGQDLGLPQGQADFGVVLGVGHDEVLNLVAPEHGITLFTLGLVPDFEKLLGWTPDQ